MTEHTKGPWRTRRGSEAPDDMIVMDEEGASVADCSPGNPYMTTAEAEANARLVSAAPELLAVVRDMLSGMAYLRQREEFDPIRHPIPYGFGIERLEKTGQLVIAKTEGKL